MYGAGGGEYVWRRDLRRSRSAFKVSTWIGRSAVDVMTTFCVGRSCRFDQKPRQALRCSYLGARNKAVGLCISSKLLMYGARGGGEYMWWRNLRRSRSALSVVDPRGMHIRWVPLQGVTIWGVISGGNLQGVNISGPGIRTLMSSKLQKTGVERR